MQYQRIPKKRKLPILQRKLLQSTHKNNNKAQIKAFSPTTNPPAAKLVVKLSFLDNNQVWTIRANEVHLALVTVILMEKNSRTTMKKRREEQVLSVAQASTASLGTAFWDRSLDYKEEIRAEAMLAEHLVLIIEISQLYICLLIVINLVFL